MSPYRHPAERPCTACEDYRRKLIDAERLNDMYRKYEAQRVDEMRRASVREPATNQLLPVVLISIGVGLQIVGFLARVLQ